MRKAQFGETASHPKVHQVDCSVDSGDDDLTDGQEVEILPKKKTTKSLAEEKHERAEKLLDELKVKHGWQFWPSIQTAG